MNVYQRLQLARVELQSIPIKESGNNKFAGYTYMELGDFLPHITQLCNKHGICPVISFGEVLATLTIFNIEKPEEQIVFTSPMSTAELKGCHAIQNLGAVETYLRRYLYVSAFDIVEHDALDSTHGKELERKEEQRKPAQSGDSSKLATEGQVKLLKTKLSKANIPVDSLCGHYGIETIESLPMSSVNDAIAKIDSNSL